MPAKTFATERVAGLELDVKARAAIDACSFITDAHSEGDRLCLRVTEITLHG